MGPKSSRAISNHHGLIDQDRSPLWLMLLPMLSALPQGATAAVAGTSAQAIASATGPAEDPADVDFQQTNGPAQASAAAISPHAGASADTFAGFGVLKVIAQSNADAGGFVGVAEARGKWTDIVSLSSAGFNGLDAQITAGVTLQGFISPVGAGRGGLQLRFSMKNSNTSVNGAWDTQTPVNATGFPANGLSVQAGGTLFYSGIHEVTATVKLGDTFVIEEELIAAVGKLGCDGSATAQCLASDSGAVDVDFGHSSYWNGIKSIKVKNPTTGLFELADLSLFTVSSSSNTNYMGSFVPAPVPIPTAAWLLGSALVGLTARRRIVSTGWHRFMLALPDPAIDSDRKLFAPVKR